MADDDSLLPISTTPNSSDLNLHPHDRLHNHTDEVQVADDLEVPPHGHIGAVALIATVAGLLLVVSLANFIFTKYQQRMNPNLYNNGERKTLKGQLHLALSAPSRMCNNSTFENTTKKRTLKRVANPDSFSSILSYPPSTFEAEVEEARAKQSMRFRLLARNYRPSATFQPRDDIEIIEEEADCEMCDTKAHHHEQQQDMSMSDFYRQYATSSWYLDAHPVIIEEDEELHAHSDPEVQIWHDSHDTHQHQPRRPTL